MHEAYGVYGVYEVFAKYEGLDFDGSYYRISSTYIGKAVNMSYKIVALSIMVT